MEEKADVAEQDSALPASARANGRTCVLKHGETFAVFDRFGDIISSRIGEHGLYHQGTRFLSRLTLRLNGHHPMLLHSNVKQDNSLLTVDLTTPDFYEAGTLSVMRDTVHVFRAKLLWRGACYERLRVVNYDDRPVSLQISMEYDADYADIFEVRGFRRARRGQDQPPAAVEDRMIFGYCGLDGATRRTIVSFAPRPVTLAPGRVEYCPALAPKGMVEIHVTVMCESALSEPVAAIDYVSALEESERAMRGARARGCSIYTSNEQFNDWINRSSADLVMLATDDVDGPYPYAGVPWYSTPFGRDGITTALEYLWVDPSMARGVLGLLARLQAVEENRDEDSEPGKIIHETRKGELAALGEIPFGRYYGSVDSTPLFVALAGAYYQRTGDLNFVSSIWPNVLRALEWIARYGDVDGDGFVEYQRKSEKGLRHQGWKDSEDAIFHADGRLAEGAIALAEVQGYTYLAKLHAAEIAHALGEKGLGDALRREALQLREHFEQAFWCEELGTFSIALDGEKRQCQVRSSNAGQVLWSGIARRSYARRTADTLLAPASFSGWGVRTLAEGEARYNPMSYHNGSVWPHDNALIAMALARYEMKEEALAILTAMFDASIFMDLHRLPELFCGFVRRRSEGPTLYPVACLPQAWASASPFYFLQACLGLTFHARAPRIRFHHPVLPEFLKRVEISNLHAGDAIVDLALERHERDVGINVLRKKGEVAVSVTL